MGSKIISYGAITERSIDGGTTWERIEKRTGIAIPSIETNYIDATDLDSPNGFKEYLVGMKDAGELTLPGYYTSDVYSQQLADEALGVPVMYRSTLKLQDGQATTGDRFEFSGFPSPQVQESGTEDVIGMDIVIRTTGEVTYTQGS